MSARDTAITLDELRDNILLARDFIQGMALEEFVRDTRTLYACIRCLEVISEATRRLPDEFLMDRHQHIPWRNVKDAGNQYRQSITD